MINTYRKSWRHSFFLHPAMYIVLMRYKKYSDKNIVFQDKNEMEWINQIFNSSSPGVITIYFQYSNFAKRNRIIQYFHFRWHQRIALCHILKRTIGRECVILPLDFDLLFLIYSYLVRCNVKYGNIQQAI